MKRGEKQSMGSKAVTTGTSAGAVNGKSLRFPTQAPEKLRAFRHSTFIVLASLGK
jgi:hypothetical protein